MTLHPTAPSPGTTGDDFRTADGLRALLIRLEDAGEGAWEHDPAAASLMEFAAEKYAALARKHGLDPWEAASAAFDVMRTRAARTAIDPWAVITHAVRITCIAEERAQGLLCSVNRARRPQFSAFHDPERLSDRENSLTDYHPAFRAADPADSQEEDEEEAPAAGHDPAEAAATAGSAMEDAIALFTSLGWPPASARSSIEHVCGTLARSGTRHAAYEALRRDKHARALLDLSRTSWMTLLKALLGHPSPAFAATSTGRGILLRLLIGEGLTTLLHDDDLVLAIALAAPGRRTGDRR